MTLGNLALIQAQERLSRRPIAAFAIAVRAGEEVEEGGSGLVSVTEPAKAGAAEAATMRADGCSVDD